MAAYISLNLSTYSSSVFADYVDNITNNMEGNADYPAPPVPWATITAQMVTFRTYLVDPELLSTFNRKLRDKLRGEIQDKLKRNGQYAILLFPTDAAKQQATGFPPAKTRVRMTTPPERPSNLRVRAGRTGEVILNCQKKKGTRSIYIHIYDHEPVPTHRYLSSTSTKGVVIDGLVSGRQYFFEVQAIGTVGPSDWAGPVDIFAP